MLERTLSAINSPGGHILICLGLLVLYSLMTGNPMSHDVTVFALGILSRSMGSKNSPDPVIPDNVKVTSTVETVATTEPKA